MTLATNILSTVIAGGQIFAGYGGVTLGPVKLSGLAKPKFIPIGGRQAVVTHKLPGGGRVLDVMGPDNADIGWSGYLEGSNPSFDARLLDNIRQSGQAITLAWDIFSYTVLLTEFACDIQHAPMPYRVLCTVIADNSQAIASEVISLSLQISTDLASALDVQALSSSTQAILGSSLTEAASAVSLSGATTMGSAAYTSANNLVGTADAQISIAIGSVSSQLMPIGTTLCASSSTAPVGLDAIGLAGQLETATTACGDLAQLAMASGYTARASSNLQRACA